MVLYWNLGQQKQVFMEVYQYLPFIITEHWKCFSNLLFKKDDFLFVLTYKFCP